MSTALLSEDIGDFASFVNRARAQRAEKATQKPSPQKTTLAQTATTEPVENSAATVNPGPLLSHQGLVLTAVKQIALHQKIRRAFMNLGIFRFDIQRQDVVIKQLGNIITIDINLDAAPNAYELSIEAWKIFRTMMLNTGWVLDLEECFLDSQSNHLHILFSTDRLLTK